jgi:serine protease AprX
MSNGATNLGRRVFVAVALAAAVCAATVRAQNRPAPPAGARVIDVAGSAVRVAVWEEAGANGEAEAWYGISLDGQTFQHVSPARYEINIAGLSFDPLAAGGRASRRAGAQQELRPPFAPAAPTEPAVPAELAAPADSRLYIVQFHTQSLSVYRQQITALGGTILRYLPQQAHLVEMDAPTLDAVAALPFVRWVGPYQPAFKLEPVVRDRLIAINSPIPNPQPALYGPQGGQGSAIRYNVMVCHRGPRQKGIVAERIRELGGTIDQLSPSGFRLEATLSPEQLLAVVRMDEVLFIDRWSEPRPCMDIAREIGGANYVESVAGYAGAGVRAEVLECCDALDTTHQDFQAIPPLLHGAVGTVGNHATGVYGIVFGDGTGNAAARGMLPQAQGIFANRPVFDEAFDRYAHTAELLADPYYAVLQSNSWAVSRAPGSYSTVSAELDDILLTHDLLILHAHGNLAYGPYILFQSDQGLAKNVVSVGGVQHQNTLTKADDSWANGPLASTPASYGPAPDGRIKPDLTHFYDNVLTTYPGNQYTPGFWGTSAATPITAGHFGLFFEMWADGLFGNPLPHPGGTVFENRPHAATAKAMMINTASQYPFAGTDHDLTRTHQGWGMADVRRLYDLRARFPVIVDETDVLTELGSTQYPVVVAAGQAALRTTLVYTDPAGVPNVNPNRVNDLTLKVTSPSAVVYWGNNGLLAGNWSTPGGNANTIDTVENVFVQSPEPGTWTVEVLASEINADAHPETPGVDDADYALVVSIEPPPVVGDLDGDWGVDMNDFALFAGCLAGPGNVPGCAPGIAGDLDGDGDCDLADFAAFAEGFGQ